MIGAGTRLYALLGQPVAHSLSPAMHNAAFRALGIDAVYLALACEASRVGPLMAAIAEAGGGGNITIPHKTVAAGVVAGSGDAAGAACNTFWHRDGALCGANTDPDGVAAGLATLGVTGGDWLVCGTGGSARGVVEAAARAGARLAVRSRAPERAAALLEVARGMGVAACAAEECDVIVHATPLGLQRTDPVPLSLADHPGVRVVLDLVYAPGETPLVRAARAMGLRAADGREVLLGQGAAAFRHWFPEIDPPVEIMRAALRDRLG